MMGVRGWSFESAGSMIEALASKGHLFNRATGMVRR